MDLDHRDVRGAATPPDRSHKEAKETDSSRTDVVHSSRAVTRLARGEIAELGMPRSAVVGSAPGGHDPLKQVSTWAASAWMVHEGGRDAVN